MRAGDWIRSTRGPPRSQERTRPKSQQTLRGATHCGNGAIEAGVGMASATGRRLRGSRSRVVGEAAARAPGSGHSRVGEMPSAVCRWCHGDGGGGKRRRRGEQELAGAQGGPGTPRPTELQSTQNRSRPSLLAMSRLEIAQVVALAVSTFDSGFGMLSSPHSCLCHV